MGGVNCIFYFYFFIFLFLFTRSLSKVAVIKSVFAHLDVLSTNERKLCRQT